MANRYDECDHEGNGHRDNQQTFFLSFFSFWNRKRRKLPGYFRLEITLAVLCCTKQRLYIQWQSAVFKIQAATINSSEAMCTDSVLNMGYPPFLPVSCGLMVIARQVHVQGCLVPFLARAETFSNSLSPSPPSPASCEVQVRRTKPSSHQASLPYRRCLRCCATSPKPSTRPLPISSKSSLRRPNESSQKGAACRPVRHARPEMQLEVTKAYQPSDSAPAKAYH